MNDQHVHLEDQPSAQSSEELADPIGPVALRKRTRIGARAFVLVGAMGVLAAGVGDLPDSTFTTI